MISLISSDDYVILYIYTHTHTHKNVSISVTDQWHCEAKNLQKQAFTVPTKKRRNCMQI